MNLSYALIATLVGCLLFGKMVTNSARRRGISNAKLLPVIRYMSIGLCLGEFIWLPFSIDVSTSGSIHPLTFIFNDQNLISLPLSGIMGCISVVATLYWGCTSVVLGLLSYRGWKIKLPDATRVYLPWVSLWTLAHIAYFWNWANSFS